MGMTQAVKYIMIIVFVGDKAHALKNRVPNVAWSRNRLLAKAGLADDEVRIQAAGPALAIYVENSTTSTRCVRTS
jgi:hypothetical protein